MSRLAEKIFEEAQKRGRDASPSYVPNTANETEGTVDAIFATDAPVLSFNWEIGSYYEILSFDKAHVRMERLLTAAPILDKHNSYSDDLGIVEPGSSVLGKTNITGKLRFDLKDIKGAGLRAFNKVKDGFWRTFSIGYRVYKLRYIEDAEDGLPIYRAVDWEPMEVSTAPMAADIDSQARSEGAEKGRNSKIEIQNKPNMEKIPAELEQERIAADLEIQKRITAAKVEGADEAVKLENKRVLDIIAMGEKHKLDSVIVRKALEEKTSVDKFGLVVLDALHDRQPKVKGNIRVITKFNSDNERAAAMTEGILVRMNSSKYEKDATIKENPYRHRTLLELSDEFYESRGGDMTLSTRQRVTEAIKMQAREVGMSTSDLPNLFANVLHKILRKEYTFQTGKWKEFCYNQPASHINQDETSINLGDFQELKKVTEGGEYKAQSVADQAEKFRASKYGSLFFITIEMIINDDLGGMERMGMKAAKADAFTEDFLAWALLQSNPNMSDGNAVFSTAHKNLDTGAAISTTSLASLWLKMTKQTGLNGKPLDIDPKYIITGRSNQAALDQILNPNLMPITPGDAVQSYIKLLTPIYTNYIDDNRFYLAASPSDIDTIRFGGLVGEPDFAMENYYEPARDAWAYKMRKYFGIAYTDFRGLALNPGV